MGWFWADTSNDVQGGRVLPLLNERQDALPSPPVWSSAIKRLIYSLTLLSQGALCTTLTLLYLPLLDSKPQPISLPRVQ